MATSDIFNLADTWNNGATVFTGFKFNVTNTASATASKIFDFQLAGVTVLNLDKNKSLILNNAGTAAIPAFQFADANTGLYGSGGIVRAASFGVEAASFGANATHFTGNVGIGSSSSLSRKSYLTSATASDHLEQRNTTTAQLFSVYATTAQAATAAVVDYERVTIRPTATGHRIRAEAGGTGTIRPLTIGAFSKAGVPTTTDIPAGDFAVVRDTSGATTKLYYNNAGTLESVALA